jgi:hypothetical protein
MQIAQVMNPDSFAATEFTRIGKCEYPFSAFIESRLLVLLLPFAIILLTSFLFSHADQVKKFLGQGAFPFALRRLAPR